MKINIQGRTFVKSSHSGSSSCVGVEINNDKISVINTNEKKTIVEFTKDEWIAFIKGVKDCEFDI